MHETREDRQNQRRVMEFIQRNLLARTPFVGAGFRYTEIPTEPDDSKPDFDIWMYHLHVGVVEIKCRTGRYNADYFLQHGYMLDSRKLNSLQKSDKMGFKALFAFESSDGRVFYTTMQRLMANRDSLQKADPEMMMTTNHGKDKRKVPFRGYIIPLSLFEEIRND